MFEKCTNTSSPSSREMKPKRFSALKNFTVPVANCLSLQLRTGPRDQLGEQCTGPAGPLLVAVGDPTPAEVVRGHLDLHPVPGEDADAVLAHLAAQMAEHGVAIVEADAEVAPLEGLLGASFKDESIIFCLRQAVGPRS